jgi:hypothetical protein
MTASKLTIAAVLAFLATSPLAFAQNTSNPLTTGNTSNPLMSGNTVRPLVAPQSPENAVSPALPSGLIPGQTSGTNPLTGLPCSGAGSLAVTGTGTLPGASSPPVNGSSTTPVTPAFSSVFGTISGAC